MRHNNLKDLSIDLAFLAEPLIKKALTFFPAHPNSNSLTALDIGAGDGINALYLAQNSLSVTALDKNIFNILQIQQNAQLYDLPLLTMHQDISAFFPREKFHILLSLGVLHWLPQNCRLPLLQKMQQQTHHNGLNIVSANLPLPLLIGAYKDWKILHVNLVKPSLTSHNISAELIVQKIIY